MPLAMLIRQKRSASKLTAEETVEKIKAVAKRAGDDDFSLDRDQWLKYEYGTRQIEPEFNLKYISKALGLAEDLLERARQMQERRTYVPLLPAGEDQIIDVIQRYVAGHAGASIWLVGAADALPILSPNDDTAKAIQDTWIENLLSNADYHIVWALDESKPETLRMLFDVVRRVGDKVSEAAREASKSTGKIYQYPLSLLENNLENTDNGKAYEKQCKLYSEHSVIKMRPLTTPTEKNMKEWTDLRKGLSKFWQGFAATLYLEQATSDQARPERHRDNGLPPEMAILCLKSVKDSPEGRARPAYLWFDDPTRLLLQEWVGKICRFWFNKPL